MPDRKVSRQGPGISHSEASTPCIVVAAGQADGILEASLGAVKVLVGIVLVAAQCVRVRKGGVQLQGPLEVAKRAFVLLQARKHLAFSTLYNNLSSGNTFAFGEVSRP